MSITPFNVILYICLISSFFRTMENETPLQHAIKRHLPVVVEVLCQRGVDMNITDNNNNCPLWQALDSGQEDIAQTLVIYYDID